MKIPIECGKIDDYHDDDDEGEEMKMKMKMMMKMKMKMKMKKERKTKRRVDGRLLVPRSKQALPRRWRARQAVLEMAAFGAHAHARQASVNEPSGARLFSVFWVESFPLR